MIGQNVKSQVLIIPSKVFKAWWAECVPCAEKMVKPTRYQHGIYGLDMKAQCFHCGQRYVIKLQNETQSEFEERNWNEKQEQRALEK